MNIKKLPGLKREVLTVNLSKGWISNAKLQESVSDRTLDLKDSYGHSLEWGDIIKIIFIEDSRNDEVTTRFYDDNYGIVDHEFIHYYLHIEQTQHLKIFIFLIEEINIEYKEIKKLIQINKTKEAQW